MLGMYLVGLRRKQTYGILINFANWLFHYFHHRTDPNTKQILESMRAGAINIKQAAEALGMEPAMLAYQLAGRVSEIHYFID